MIDYSIELAKFSDVDEITNLYNELNDYLKEAAKLGFARALIPEANKPRQAVAGMEIIAVRRVEEAFNRLRELE